MEERVLDVRERKAIRRVVERDEVRELLRGVRYGRDLERGVEYALELRKAGK